MTETFLRINKTEWKLGCIITQLSREKNKTRMENSNTTKEGQERVGVGGCSRNLEKLRQTECEEEKIGCDDSKCLSNDF